MTWEQVIPVHLLDTRYISINTPLSGSKQADILRIFPFGQTEVTLPFSFETEEKSSGSSDLLHFVNLTGTVIEFEDKLIEQRQQQMAAEKGYKIIDHNLILFVEPID